MFYKKFLKIKMNFYYILFMLFLSKLICVIIFFFLNFKYGDFRGFYVLFFIIWLF